MRNKIYSLIIVAIVWLACTLMPAIADEDASKLFDEYKIKAVFLYNFTKYVKWPDGGALLNTHNVNVCVYGENPFGGKLDILEKASSLDLAFHIKRGISEGEVSICQILFISKSEAVNVGSLLRDTRNYPVLTVSDIEGFARDGGIVEMNKSENNIGKKSIKLIINLRSAEEKHLDIDPQLLSIAGEVLK